MGVHACEQQFGEGFPIVGPVEEPGVFPTHACPDPELSREQAPASSKWRLKAGRGFITDPNEGISWEEALDQAKNGRPGGPYQFDDEGRPAVADIC